jgi:glycosyltransferase involved in cell wall biosynthesis
MPRASVIVAVKNGAAMLQRCLDSAFAQAGADAEVVVIDGASTDGTPGILARNAARLGYWSSAPDSGIYAAWNKGVARSRGEWLCFLGADDVFHDAAALRDLLDSAPARERTCRLVYGRINLVTRDGAVVQSAGRPWEAARDDFLAGFMIPTPAVLHHRSLFEVHGPFDETYRIAGDYEFALRELKAHPAAFVDRVVVDMQTGGMSGRPDTIHMALREIVRARATHGVPGMPPRLRRALATSRLGALLYRIAGRRVFGALADTYRVLRGKPRIWTA